jgi:hypothetical protein
VGFTLVAVLIVVAVIKLVKNKTEILTSFEAQVEIESATLHSELTEQVAPNSGSCTRV